MRLTLLGVLFTTLLGCQTQPRVNGWSDFCILPTNGGDSPGGAFELSGRVRAGGETERPCPETLTHQFVLDDENGVTWQVAAAERPHPQPPGDSDLIYASTTVNLGDLVNEGDAIVVSAQPKSGWGGDFGYGSYQWSEQVSIRSADELVYAISSNESRSGCSGNLTVEPTADLWKDSTDADLLVFDTTCRLSNTIPPFNHQIRCDMQFGETSVAPGSSGVVRSPSGSTRVTVDAFESWSVYSTGCSGGNYESVVFWAHNTRELARWLGVGNTAM